MQVQFKVEGNIVHLPGVVGHFKVRSKDAEDNKGEKQVETGY